MLAKSDRTKIMKAIAAGHDDTVKRLQDWIANPSIAAENRNMPGGAEYMKKLALDAGFQQAEVIPTDGHPGVFATMDNGREDLVRHLLHVRREAVRSGRMVLAAAGRRSSSTSRASAR